MRKHRSFYSAFIVLAIFFLAPSGGVYGSPPVSMQTKLFADDAFKDSGFGWAVAIDKDTAVVSAFADYDNTGAVYLYTRTDSGWQQVSKLTASDGTGGDYLGISVAVSGDTVVVGAALDDNAGGVDAGAVYVFVKPQGGWPDVKNEDFKLTVPDAGAGRGFGGAVALKGNTLVVGAPGKDDSPVPGEVFVYEGSASTWNLKATLSVADLRGIDSYGAALGFDGNTIAVGAFGKDSSKGVVYVYHRPAAGWSNKNYDALLGADDGTENDYFGGSVAVDGDIILVGANGDDSGGGRKSGSAYVFKRVDENWRQQARLIASDSRLNDNFGYSVALAGDRAVVGASHFSDVTSDSIYIFILSDTSWVELGKLSDPDGKAESKFGTAVAIDESATVVIGGAFGADVGSDRAGKDAGAAYLFELAAPVNLALVKKDNTDPVLVGESLTYSLFVTNNSIDTDATGVTVIDMLPAGLSYISDDRGCSHTDQVVSCDLGTIVKNGGTGNVVITVRAERTGSVTNTAVVTANEVDADSVDNMDSEDTTIKESSGSGQNSGGGGGAIDAWLLMLFAVVFWCILPMRRRLFFGLENPWRVE